MGYETYTGIISREVDTGEADRYLTILSAERGKLECYAKGIRRQKSKLASQAGLMSYGEYQLFNNKDRYILTSAKAVEPFYRIREDVVKYAYAAHFLEIAGDVIVEAQAFPQALQTLLNALYVMCFRDMNPDFVSRVFEIRILALSGFAPMLDQCSVCGAGLEPGGADFAVYGDGLVCGGEECRNAAGRTVSVSSGALKAIKHVSQCGAAEIFKFTVNGAVASELASVIPAYLRYHFGKDYDKLEEAERYRAFEREMHNKSREKRERQNGI